MHLSVYAAIISNLVAPFAATSVGLLVSQLLRALWQYRNADILTMTVADNTDYLLLLPLQLQSLYDVLL
jgi:hypothetical protein